LTTLTPAHGPDWQAELAASFARPEDLLAFLQLPVGELDEVRRAATQFPFRVTRYYASRMRKGDPADPLLRQVLPVREELLESPGFLADPVGDLRALATPGLLHKYRGRALLVTTGACAINCRYCFRREFPYREAQWSRRREAEALAYLASDPGIAEVILSGGDPLSLSDGRLAALLHELASIDHLQRLRIHTRLPLVLPSRVTPELAVLLRASRWKVVLVIHANHARELGDEVGSALAALRKEGVMLLNQSVLLRGVNDDVSVLAELSLRLFELGILPYYLHTLDKARGTAHFDLPRAKAQALHERLRGSLPGYLVPRLVSEEAGKPYKTWHI